MKKRYWLPALILVVLGAATYFLIYSYSFSGLVMIALGAVLFAFGLTDALKGRLPKLMRFLRTVMLILLAVTVLAGAVTGILIMRAGFGEEDADSDYLIVLGAGVNGNVPSRSLRERLTAAESYLKAHPDTVAILSGGQGDRENLTEAQCMFNWLTEKGIPADQLRMEDRATSTEENIRYSLDLIEAESGVRPEKCAVLSSSYHLFRASLLARREGLEMIGIRAKARPMYYCNMLLREIVGVWYTLIFR